MARAVLGLPMYNSEAYVADVIESLLALEYDDFAIVAIDDCSPDNTYEIARAFSERDPRIVVERNARRLGMIGNWNATLDRAYVLHPDFAYFAFASDNDLRKPPWLAQLAQALEAHEDAALAYSRFATTDAPEREKARWLFDTRGITDPLERQRTTTDLVRAGPVMYGLHRRRTLELAGRVPEVLLSDVLFLSHLSLYGTFVQTDDVLWFRGERRTGWSGARQRRALFADAPATAYLPVSLQHTLWLLRNMVFGTLRPPGMSRATALYVSVRYLADWWRRHYRRVGPAVYRWRKKRRKTWRRRRRLLVRVARATGRPSAYRRVWREVLARARRA